MKKKTITAALVLCSILTIASIESARAEVVRHTPKSVLSRCIAKAKKKKGALARNKAIRACYNRR